MSIESEADLVKAEQLSALVDGELESGQMAGVLSAWRNDPQTQARWHSYQLIGDVLRSDDLATHASHDQDFLAKLRGRLALEPVVLAPDSRAATRSAELGEPELPAQAEPMRAAAGAGRLSAPGRRARRWMAPTAIAAGFVVVVGAVMVTQAPVVPAGGPVVAGTSGPAAERPAPDASRLAAGGEPAGNAGLRSVSAAPESAAALVQETPVAPRVVDGMLIRDPRLDRYLEAHKQFAGSTVLGASGGYLRNAAADAGR